MTSKTKNCFLAAMLASVFAMMMFSCAQVGTITGGEKDTIAPYIRKSKPENYSPDFDKKKVKIKFNEYYSLDKIDQTFLMTPPQDSLKPKIKVKGKWLVVKFKEPLKDDSTYTLQFFNSVKDYNEGNILKNFQFVFSTGNTVDSCAVSGRVVDAQTLKKEAEILVCLYGEQTLSDDSCFVKYKPDYITRTDTAGYFKLPNVRNGRYKIVALKDINETQRFDLENEKIAFINTILETKAEHVTKIDSLSAGTILHMGAKGHRYLDTLKTDSVIVQDLIYTTPNNITLYTFEEKHLVQYISERQRDIRQRIKLTFNKSVENDTVLITYVDDTLKSPDMIYDFNYGRDSLIVWLRDTADINNDTLQIRVSFTTLDSLKQPTIETDTLSVKFSNRKVVSSKGKDTKKTAETGIDSLSFKIKSNFSGDFDIKKSIKIQVPIMVDSINTSLIKLYECVDSTFEENMNQKKIKAVRLDSANYRLVFQRPILGNIVWYPTDTVVGPDWYVATYSPNRDTIDIEVLDSAMIHKTKFNNMLKYHNAYYLDQVQKIRDSVPTLIVNQKILKYNRPSRDTITIELEKIPAQGVEIIPINIDKVPEGGIEIVQDRFNITLLLHDSTAVRKDTLALKFHSYDRMILNRNQKIVEQTYKDTLFAIYKIKFQTLKNKELIGKDTMRFVFGRALKSIPEVSLINYPEKGTGWYNYTLSDTKDTITIISDDNDFLNMDTIKYSISYPTLDKKENEIIQTDTLEIVRPVEVKTTNGRGNKRKSSIGKEVQKEQEEAKKNMSKASLRFPVEYEMTTDSMDMKNKIITFESEPGKNYMLEVDDSTFTSIYGTPNLYLNTKAKIRELDYYGQIKISIQNVGNIEHYPDIDEDIPPFEEIDTTRELRRRINPKDTMAAEYCSISEGQILVCLCNEKGDIKYMKAIKTDSEVVFEYIVPADYKLKLIHDRNSNNKWDTGKYIERVYPERTLEFTKKQTVKSKWTTEVVWRL